MERYDPNRDLSGLYVSRSPYSEESVAPEITLVYENRWHKREEAKDMVTDAETLAAFLKPVKLPYGASVAEQVFGGQKRQHSVSLEHALNLLNERAKLHRRFIKDIDFRHRQIQDRLNGARLHGRLDGYKLATRIEQTLVQLDEQRRQEQLRFWQDTVELREKLFEAAKEYKALGHRMSWLEGVEGPYTDDG